MSGQKNDFLNLLFSSIHDGIYEVDQDGRVITWNAGAEQITGIRGKKVIGTDCRNNPVKHLCENGRELAEKHLPILATLKDGIRREIMICLKHADGFRVAALARTIPVLDDSGKVVGALEVFNDSKRVIAAFQQKELVEQTVLLDTLTGIGNRLHIESMIRSALEDFYSCNEPFGILFIDIDHFKEFNDQHGHLTGDRVLRFVANTLRHHLRLRDSCGRWGGDEFIALVTKINCDGLKIVAEKLRSLVESGGISENERELKVTISVGAAMVHREDILQCLLQRADELMYRSKQAGRNRVAIEE